MSMLKEIFNHKRTEVLAQRASVPLHEIRLMAQDAAPSRGFRQALETASGVGLIAEVKKASPSEGVIRENFDPAEIATIYEQNGAHCLSVLTDEKYFQGSRENLQLAREATNLPILRKDFIEDPYQVYQSRAWGADAILLIVAHLTLGQVTDLMGLAFMLGMDCLVEIHDELEMQTALAAEANMIGVNNRDLSSMTTDLRNSLNLIPRFNSKALAISESGINTLDDVRRVANAGAQGVLIGTTFCRAEDIGHKVRQVMGTDAG